MRIKRIISIMMIVLMIMTLAGCGKKDKQAMSPNIAIPVVTEKANTGSINRTTVINGTIAPKEEVILMSKIAAQVVAVPFSVGDTVEKGQTILKLDDTTFALQVKQAAASLSISQAQTSAKAVLDNAKAELARYQSLYESGAVSEQLLEQKELAYTNAVSQYQVSLAQMDQGQAMLDIARDNLNNTALAAPITGVITARNIDPGEMASPAAPVLTIANVDQVIVKANLTESEIGKVHLNQKVQVEVASGVEQVFEGEITSINPAASEQSKVYPIEINIENPNHVLKAGMFARVTIELEKKENVMVLPKTALVNKEDGETKIVYVTQKNTAKEENWIVKEREVQVGLEGEETVEILAGIKEGETVVISGQLLLSDGTEVTSKSRGEQ